MGVPSEGHFPRNGCAMSPSLPHMQGKTCLVTGATSGIGLVTARELARLGARVVLVGRNPEKLQSTLAHIQAATGSREVDALPADLAVQKSIQELPTASVNGIPAWTC